MSSIFEFSQLKFPELENKLDRDGTQRLLNNIVALMLSQRLDIFDKEGGDDKWKPLSDDSFNARINKIANTKIRNLARKGKKIPDQLNIRKTSVKILQDKGLLRQSFSAARGSGNMYRFTYTTDSEAGLESHLPYAAIQNFGGTIVPKTKKALSFFNSHGMRVFARKVTIPARPFNQFREADLKELQELISNFLGDSHGQSTKQSG